MNIKLPNKRYLAIVEIYAFIAMQDDGEGVMGFYDESTKTLMPMIGADLAMVERLRPIADEEVRRNGTKYEIRYFRAVQQKP